MALAFREKNVDGFLAGIDADQYAEWQAFFALEPWGWPAVQMAVRRLTWAVFQRGRREPIDERLLSLRTAAEAMPTPAQQRVREEIAEARWTARAAADAAETR